MYRDLTDDHFETTNRFEDRIGEGSCCDTVLCFDIPLLY